MNAYSSSSSEDDMILKVFISDVSSSESSSDEENFSSSEDEGLRRHLSRSQNFVEIIVPSYNQNQFKKHFRISRTTFNHLLNLISLSNILSSSVAGRENVGNEKGLLLTLWYLVNQETYRQISDRFNISQSTAFVTIKKIVKYFVEVKGVYIKWPTQQEAENIARAFQMRQGLEHIIGAIDATHISINRPHSDQLPYCNRKGTHSIILQGVVDDKKRFTNIYCGESGGNHDARVFRRCALYTKFYRDGLPHGMCLLGESAYPELNWMVVPFKDNGLLTSNEKLFNYRHSATRIIIENAFGLLKGRFRRLRHFDNIDLCFVTEATVAACVLHNICIDMDDIYVDDHSDTELM